MGSLPQSRSSSWNGLRIQFARLLIAVIDWPWRAGEKVLKRRFSVKKHYLIMNLFRFLFRKYNVTVVLHNPVHSPMSEDTPQGTPRIKFRLDLCQNTQNQYFRVKGQDGVDSIALIPHEATWIILVGQAMHRVQSFIDIGAHVGIYSLTVAQAFPEQRVVAVEPRLANYSKLVDNARDNGLSNLEPVHAAVTDSHEPVRFYSNPLNDGGGSIIEPSQFRTGDVSVDAEMYRKRHHDFDPWTEVDSIRLDDLLVDTSVVKIDVEGAELEVLRSGINALRSNLADVMVIEVSRETVEDVIDLMAQLGFDCFLHGQREPIASGVQAINSFDRIQGNILCLRRQANLSETLIGLQFNRSKVPVPGSNPPMPRET